MYCSNCGLQLPDWANFCERCGARVQRSVANDDPLDHVGLDDTTSYEPLWPAHSSGSETAQPEERDGDSPVAPEPEVDVSAQTVLLEPEDQEPSEDVPQDDEGSQDGPKSDQDPKEDSDDHREQDHAQPSSASEEESAALAEASESVEEGPDESSSAEGDQPEEEPDAAEADEPVAEEPPVEEGPRKEPEYIDVGDEDGPLMMGSPVRHHVNDTWQGRQRPSERRTVDQSTSMKAVAIAAAAAIAFGFFVAFILMGGSGSSTTEQNAGGAVTHRISKSEASQAISTLDGWWATDRTFDGRTWHIKDGLMETYAADGQLAKQELVEASYVERMDAGPGGIEGQGYYFRDIAFYLLDNDPNTLHAINGDGTADENANLFRTDPPAFMGTGTEPAQPVATEVADASEYVLPESNVRVYETSELEALSDHDLFLARNEIYARHGYVFQAGELSEYFSSKSWYHPSDVFNEGDISEVERQNVSTILSLEHTRGSQYV